MRVSELIKELQEIQNKQGDLCVVIPYRGCECDWETLDYIDIGEREYLVYSTKNVINEVVVTLE